MIFVNSNGRVVRVRRMGKPGNMINRYCHFKPNKAVVGNTEGCYSFTYPSLAENGSSTTDNP